MDIVILVIIIIILTLILFLALRKLVDSISKDSKDYYFKKVQDLDSKLEEKRQELDSIEPQEKRENVESKDRIIKQASLDRNLLDIINSTDYESINALKIANKVDEIFSINEEEILKKFIENIEVNKNYEHAVSMQARFSPNLIYKLKNLDTKTQIKEIGKMLSDEEYEIFSEYIKRYKFKLNKFLLDLSLLIEKIEPKIEVLVGQKNKNYDHLSKYIKTIYSEDVYKGIIIKYQDRIYDYSINERDVD